jgi:hypothetical protein
MKLPEEILALARHLMVFLVAVLAFVTKDLTDSHNRLVAILFLGSLFFAYISFLRGYRTMFTIFNHYIRASNERRPKSSPSDAGKEQEPSPPPADALRYLRHQYFLTIISLGLLALAIAWRITLRILAVGPLDRLPTWLRSIP